jgi:type I restriction enzyme S subunit
MGNNWPRVKLGDVLRRSEEIVALQPDTEYREITVKLWGKGVVPRGIVTGAEVAASRRMVARCGQFIFSRIDARNGALGIVPENLDRAIVSSDFPTFDLATERLLPSFLGWMCKTASFLDKCQHASEGTTNRVRLQEAKFLATEIFLPPLAEQRRIVARIEEFAGRIEEVHRLRRKATEEGEVLNSAAVNSVFDPQLCAERWPLRRLLEVASVARGKFTHRPRNEPRFYGGSFPFIQIADISNSKRYIQKYSQSLNDQGLAISRMFPAGTLVIAITGATIGVTGILTFDSCFPDSIVGIQAKPDLVTPEFIYFAVEHAKKAALAEATQTTQPNINLGNFERLQVRVPPLPEQQQIVGYLDDLQKRTDCLRAVQTESSTDLDALMPSILDKAFRGDL